MPTTHSRRVLLAGAGALLLLALDLVTKDLAKAALDGRAPIEVISGFWNWKYAENRDVGFSLLRSVPDDLRRPLILGLVSVGILAVTLFGLRRAGSKLALTGTALILAGAIGNLADRLRLGYVIDFVHWYVGSFSWPIFNLADVYVSVGVAMLLTYEWNPQRFGGLPREEESPDAPEPPPPARGG